MEFAGSLAQPLSLSLPVCLSDSFLNLYRMRETVSATPAYPEQPAGLHKLAPRRAPKHSNWNATSVEPEVHPSSRLVSGMEVPGRSSRNLTRPSRGRPVRNATPRIVSTVCLTLSVMWEKMRRYGRGWIDQCTALLEACMQASERARCGHHTDVDVVNTIREAYGNPCALKLTS